MVKDPIPVFITLNYNVNSLFLLQIFFENETYVEKYNYTTQK